MKFRSLPGQLADRIGALTPTKIGHLLTKIHIITEDCSIPSAISDNRTTYVNLRCKKTDRLKSHKLNLRSSRVVIKSALQILESKGHNVKYVYDSAIDSGWTQSDINYDSMINGLLANDIANCIYNNAYIPEIDYLPTHVIILITNYYNQQYIGWYMYNDSTDYPENYSNYKM